jgi:hypothetical protein
MGKIKLTEKGTKLFEATSDYSINQINAVQSIVYEPTITSENFAEITGLPATTIDALTKDKLIIIL